MIRWRSIITGILCGIVFESILSAPSQGFYLVSIILVSMLYTALPLTKKFLNIGIAWLCGVSFMSIWALLLADGHIFSFNYFVHLIIIITFCSIIIYVADSKK
ncbi:MAG: hypothetical protein AAB795_02695 [Patescibacteria group bacterium]